MTGHHKILFEFLGEIILPLVYYIGGVSLHGTLKEVVPRSSMLSDIASFPGLPHLQLFENKMLLNI